MDTFLRRLISLTLIGIVLLVLVVRFSSVAAQTPIPDNGNQESREQCEKASPIKGVSVRVEESAFTVFWQTDVATVGRVEYGPSPDRLELMAFDERGPDVVDTQHRVTVSGLEPGSVCYCAIVSGDGESENARSLFKVLIGAEQESLEPQEREQPADSPDRPADTVVAVARPTGVMVAEEEDTQFTVVWQTAQRQTGWVEYGTFWEHLEGIAFDERGRDAMDTRHQVTVSGLQAGTVYYYAIVSGDAQYDNAGSLFKIVAGGKQQRVELLAGKKSAGARENTARSVEPARPIGVRIAEVEATQFTVEWHTSQPQTGWVEYGSTWALLQNVAYDGRGQDTADVQHRVTVSGLQPGCVYYYIIVSDGQQFDNGGSAFKIVITT